MLNQELSNKSLAWQKQSGGGSSIHSKKVINLYNRRFDNDSQTHYPSLPNHESKYRQILESLPDLVCRFNARGIVLDYFPPNNGKETPSAEAFIGKTVEEIWPSDLAEYTRYFLEQTLTTGEVQQGEYVMLEEGTWQYYEIRYIPSGKDEVIAIVRDIADRKRAEAALRLSQAREREKALQLEKALKEIQQTQSQLVQMEKMSSLGQMVAGIVHEINNPVNFIYGNLEHTINYLNDLMELVNLYRRHYPQPVPEIEEHIESIDLDFLQSDLLKLISSMEVGTSRISDIVRSLRNFSCLDKSEKRPTDIHQGLESTLLIIQHRLKAKENKPEIKLIKEYGSLPLVECYGGLLNQVFVNLLTNAIDALEIADPSIFATQEPTVTIRTESTEHGVKVWIKDNGPGIPADVQTHLFDPFFTTKPVGKGTGLGLSISYAIVVEKHGGQLQCCSQVGSGTTFLVEIPFVK